MRGKYFTGLLAGLFFACGLGMTVFGSEADPELYGTPSMAPAYGSVEEFQSAVHTLYEGWTDGLAGCSLINDEFGVMVTFPDRSKNMIFSYMEEDNGISGSIRMIADSKQELDSDAIEQMISFATILFSGETAGLGQEARQDIKLAANQEDTQTRFGFKRINGINYNYSCMVSAERLPEAFRKNEFYMSISTYEMMRKLEHENSLSLSLSDLINQEGDYRYLSDIGGGRYRVEGRLEEIQMSEQGEITGILTDGTEKAFLRINSYRKNSLEECKNATFFYVVQGSRLDEQNYDGPCYLATLCQ